jgi:hypothetical protein
VRRTATEEEHDAQNDEAEDGDQFYAGEPELGSRRRGQSFLILGFLSLGNTVELGIL